MPTSAGVTPRRQSRRSTASRPRTTHTAMPAHHSRKLPMARRPVIPPASVTDQTYQMDASNGHVTGRDANVRSP